MTPSRTLDALHLASRDWLRMQGQSVQLAGFDEHLVADARRLAFEIAEVLRPARHVRAGEVREACGLRAQSLRFSTVTARTGDR